MTARTGLGRKLLLATIIATAVSARAFAAGVEEGDADPYRSTYVAPDSPDVLIVGATVLDGTGGMYRDTDLLLGNGRIVSIGSNLVAEPGTTTVSAAGRWVTPGLIDVHSHDGTFSLPLTDDSLADISEVSSPNVAGTWIEHAINVQDPSFRHALEGGVTTLQVLPGSVPLFGGRSVILKPIRANTVYDMKFPDAPPGLKMACGENPKSNFGERGVAPTSRQGEVAMMREAWSKARSYLERKTVNEGHEGDGRRGSPHRDKEWDPMLETLAGVLEGEVRVHLHCYRADDIAVMLAVAREFGYRIAAIHHAAEAYKIPELLRDAGTCAAVWSDWGGFKMEIIDSIRENAAIVDAAGACTMMHSDSPFVGQRLNVEVAKAMSAGRHAGLPITPQHAIAWITSNPARALGLDDRIGRLAPDYNADVVIWSGDPFSIYSKVDEVFIDGAKRFDRNACDKNRLTDSELAGVAGGAC